jgi:hypothetical protein
MFSFFQIPNSSRLLKLEVLCEELCAQNMYFETTNIYFWKNLERSMFHGQEGKTYMQYLLYGYLFNL